VNLDPKNKALHDLSDKMSVTLCRSCHLRAFPLLRKYAPVVTVPAQTVTNIPERPMPTPPYNERVKFFLREFPGEAKKLKEEIKHIVQHQPINPNWREHGMYEIIHRFDNQPKLDSWIVTADADNNEGFSSANFTLTKDKTAAFHGYLSQRVPKNGWQSYAGYTNISAPTPYRAFWKKTYEDWSLFTDLVLKVRGDGRQYNILIGSEQQQEAMVEDRHVYPIFTRGGPYWQTIKIPLNKFWRSRRSRTMNNQMELDLITVQHFGISCMDRAEGPYKLEIEYIALMYDRNTTMNPYYEMYDNPIFDRL